VLGFIFLLLKGHGYWTMTEAGLLPSTNTLAALFYLLTGVHAVHVLLGVIVAGYFWVRGVSSTGGDETRFENRLGALRLYWYFVDIVWICVFAAFYLF
jgi:cytochrome c oxidase subunit I+III